MIKDYGAGHRNHTSTTLLDDEELSLRLGRVRELMSKTGLKCALISDYANIFYLTGRVYAGWIYIDAEISRPLYLVRRPSCLKGESTVYVRKIEDIPAALAEAGLNITHELGLETGLLDYNSVSRIKKAFGYDIAIKDASPVMREARAVKTACQIRELAESGARHSRVYKTIPRLYQPGMTDIELQIEIERALRLEGNLGQFRISGPSMEVFMGALLAGSNADSPSPYDFALGGAGLDPSLPVGADGAIIKPGTTVLVDLGGNFNGYMTDMSRVFSLGILPDIAYKAHRTSIEIHRQICSMHLPGTEAKTLYDMALKIAEDAGLKDYFMGHRYHAGFVGHGVGIEINELPVLAPRSRDILQTGNVFALEPKFVIPEVGAVGIENTYYISQEGKAVNLTTASEEIIALDR